MSAGGDVFISEYNGEFRLHHTLSDRDPEIIEKREADRAPSVGGLRVVGEEFPTWEALDARRRELAIDIPKAPFISPADNARAMLPALRRFAIDPEQALRALRLANAFVNDNDVRSHRELLAELIEIQERAIQTVTPAVDTPISRARERWHLTSGVMA
jgi:hypothetical protein